MTYDDAASVCSAFNASLVSPKNFESAAAAFGPLFFLRVRLDAWSNETCFLDDQGQPLDILEDLGADYEVHLQPLGARGLMLMADLTNNGSFSIYDGEEWATVCAHTVVALGSNPTGFQLLEVCIF